MLLHCIVLLLLSHFLARPLHTGTTMASELAFYLWHLRWRLQHGLSRNGCGMKMIPMEHGSAIGGFLHVCILALELNG